jgi:hypothetical protein
MSKSMVFIALRRAQGDVLNRRKKEAMLELRLAPRAQAEAKGLSSREV